MLEKVFEIVKQQGPVLPVEVATKLKIDSFVAHAYLMQLAEANRIKAGKEKIGNGNPAEDVHGNIQQGQKVVRSDIEKKDLVTDKNGSGEPTGLDKYFPGQSHGFFLSVLSLVIRDCPG